ncbi:HesA/MoeB/ThiF family protein [Hymenobacter cavernae]|uniref:Molybdenum cofactor biosynthesis protein MoeB n=1 Tax=Hymenobacter cavernae TaxID=2044852 RepID=A0ABQ1TT30_9BACT|nr:HesA/MoeB/ThiF family protein [Hymenobacter cavernae]GGF01194.1 molybdenum cofactor biosynthesis protein MoeB [Hymenobacter cavernae]
MTTAELRRYDRHIRLPEIGLEGQHKLKAARVLVVGCGGLGCPVLQYLAAAGVGNLGLLDFDTVDETNLQRQVLYTTADVGRSKAEVAAEKLRAQNSLISVQSHLTRITAANARTLLADYDIVVDCSDNFATRYLLNDACVLLGKPLVFGAIFKFEGQVTVFNYQGGPTYRCLFPEPPDESPNCSEIGVLGVLPGIVGTLQANEVVKLITGVGEVLSGRLLILDALQLAFTTFSFEAISSNQVPRDLVDYQSVCETDTVPEVTADELKHWLGEQANLLLLDVREEHEYTAYNIGGRLIPLGQLAAALPTLERTQPIVVHCASGRRSQQAVRLLQTHGFEQVASLRNGLADF